MKKKLINLILDHFDEVVECGTAQGKRGQLLNDLIQREGASVSASLPLSQGGHSPKTYPFSRLQSLDIADFRGFSHEETIQLDKNYTFVYGPNGSGKSSFCEAIEYALLGYIDEAIARRIDIGEYISNTFTGTKRPPILRAVNNAGDEVEVAANPSLYNFCFIEKNRIENFGRISANTPNAKQNLLAAIFGLSEFNTFVGDFTRNISTYIDIVGRKNRELEEKSRGLQTHKENLKAAQNNLRALEKQEIELAANAGLSLSFDKLEPYIQGTDDKQGRLGKLDGLFAEEALKPICIISAADIDDGVQQLAEIARQAKERLVRYHSMRDRVCFHKLYEAAAELEEYSEAKCPLCETPTTQTVANPFENAKNRLLKLADIAKLEADLESNTGDLQRRLVELDKSLATRKGACVTLAVECPGRNLNADADTGGVDLPALIRLAETVASQWRVSRGQQNSIDAQVTKHNEKAKAQIADRQSLDQERKKLIALSHRITEIKTKTAFEQKAVERCENAISEFNTTNASLIKEAAAEKPVIELNQRFVQAYLTFWDRLTNYKDALPTRHLGELNALTLEIYNSINAGDPHYEKAESIKLPASLDDSIKIAFTDDPTREFDALHVLSEGHIRCLGLAILLAKNIQLDCPLIVFDDVVNAIDDDHRGAIRTFICTSPRLASKQVVLTTHAEQFVKELEQHFTGKNYRQHVNKLGFVADRNDRRIRIKHDSQENYIHKIQNACADAQKSEALYNCRCALESLSHKLWKKIGRDGNKTEFSVVIRSPNGIPDLMSVIGVMNKCLKKIASPSGTSKYSDISEVFDYLLDIKTVNTVVWNYLNKGTHEEEGGLEFDHTIVEAIAEKMYSLDKLVKT
ncbi:MAG: AAA family ATPase [Pirellulales bacterium]|nr:AAA family ATPase [Pirellulales bacterium]